MFHFSILLLISGKEERCNKKKKMQEIKYFDGKVAYGAAP